MSGYEELRKLGVTFRPFDGPPPREGGLSSPFSARWGSTVAILARELAALGASRIVVEIDGLEERDLRVDGLPRANARPRDAVRITFESRHGPLRYETAEFGGGWSRIGWQENMRAIALGLEALRKVDRYGVSKRGEQYRGWRQLTAGSTAAEDSIVTTEQAIAVIHRSVSDLYEISDVQGAHRAEAIREALRRTHPDRGGSDDEFRKVTKAREILST